MQPQPSGEQAVAVRHLDDVRGVGVAADERACDQLGPDVDVAGGVPDDRRGARRARRSVYPDDLSGGNGEEAERVVLAQVVLRGKGKPGHVVDRLEVLPTGACFLQLVPVEGHVPVSYTHLTLPTNREV